MPKKKGTVDLGRKQGGVYAVLGMDIEAFSTLHDDDQLIAISKLQEWINKALSYNDIQDDYIWSPAGDGGYITFTSIQACRSAVEVAFKICEKASQPDWTPRNRERIRIRFGLHAGQIQEGVDLSGEGSNVWGIGINTTSRIVAIAAPNQLLVSKQYHDGFIRNQNDKKFEIGTPYIRTLKHGHEIEVLNINLGSTCLNEAEANALRWQSIGGLWRKTVQEYKFLVHDAMESDDPIAALAASKFLLDLGDREAVENLCHMLGQSDHKPVQDYPKRVHPLFSKMPPKELQKIIKLANPLFFTSGQEICKQGEKGDSCFFPVSGTIVVDLPGRKPIKIPEGEIIGEFNLWIPNISRTATVRALDEGLCLEINTDQFKEILPEGSPFANEVYSIIKRRIITNILNSQKFFPEFDKSLSSIFECEKFSVGEKLRIDENAYIIFNGKLIIKTSGIILSIAAHGKFGSEQVVGILAEDEMPDGNEAEVIEEVVAVSLSHEKLKSLREQFPSIAKAWDGLNGQRQGEIRREKKRLEALH